MSAPATVQRMAPAPGYPQQAAAQPAQVSVATQKADIVFQFIKKITDAEVVAYTARAKSNASQDAIGLIPVPLYDSGKGGFTYISVNSQNILKFAAAAQLKKLETFDASKRKLFSEILAEAVNKLNGVQVSIINACEPDIKGQLVNSRLIRAVVIQAAGL